MFSVAELLFFFNDTAPTEIYTLAPHDTLTILAELTLPATSVWRTLTVFDPSTAVKLDPQDLPPSLVNSSRSLASSPLTVQAALLVILSVRELPVSLGKESPGALGLTVRRQR